MVARAAPYAERVVGPAADTPHAPRPAGARGEALRLGAVALVGAVSLAAVAAQMPGSSPWRWVLDGLVGVAALALLRLRHRHPVLVAVVVVLASTWAASVLGAVVLAVVSLATTRRWRPVLGVGLLLVATTVADDVARGTADRWWGQAVLTAALYAALAGFGAYQGSRRDLMAALRERAEAAEREQRSRLEQARTAERTRIAREMHDVLAHRISLVAMHAGVLAFRTDLPAEQQAATAGVVRDNANLALAELRQVLGVLRQDGDPVPAPPQPTLADLDGLVEAAADLGAGARLDVGAGTRAALRALPVATSRSAYRIVQEALTNARKHAPGAPVVVAVAGSPGGVLTLDVQNGRPTGPDTGVPGSGTGLVGVGERVRLAGGRLAHGPDGEGGYRLQAVLPWEDEELDD